MNELDLRSNSTTLADIVACATGKVLTAFAALVAIVIHRLSDLSGLAVDLPSDDWGVWFRICFACLKYLYFSAKLMGDKFR